MHYIPDFKFQENDDDHDEDSGSSSRKSRRKTKRPPSKKSFHQKAAQKLRNLMTRTFAKHQPAPSNRHREQDALLTLLHHPCSSSQQQQQDPSTPSSSISTTTPPKAHIQVVRVPSKWNRLRQSVATGEMLPDGEFTMTCSSSTEDEEEETPHERDLRIQKAQDQIRRAVTVPLWQCLLAILAYVVLSVVCFSLILEQDWTLLDSGYFAVVTFTTIGYGDVVPDTRYARLFTCVWALSGVASLGIAMGVLGSNLIAVHERQRESALVQRQTQVIGLLNPSNAVAADGDVELVKEEMPTPEIAIGYRTMEEGKLGGMVHRIHENNPHRTIETHQEPSCRTGFWVSAAFIRWILLAGYISGVLCLMAQYEGWDFPKTVYYGVITASTVGYGDICPHTEMGRLLAILFIPVAVGITASLLEMVANAIIDHRRRQYTSRMQNKPLTMEQIELMDSDGDGEVTRAEFLEFMLVAMDQVDQNLLDQLREHFHRLDVDGSGTINKADLVQVAKLKLAYNVREKLRLSNYKNYLLLRAHNSVRPTSSTEGVANVVRSVLERNSTEPTSNRSAGIAQTALSPSYQDAIMY